MLKILSVDIKSMSFKDQLLSSLADEYENNGGTYNLKQYLHEKDDKQQIFIDISQYPQHIEQYIQQSMQQYKQQLLQEITNSSTNILDENKINTLIAQQLVGIKEQINNNVRVMSEQEARMKRLSKYEPLLRNLSQVELLKIDTIQEYANEHTIETPGIHGVERGEFRDKAYLHAKSLGIPVNKPEVTKYMIEIFGYKSHHINGYDTYENRSWKHRVNPKQMPNINNITLPTIQQSANSPRVPISGASSHGLITVKRQ